MVLVSFSRLVPCKSWILHNIHGNSGFRSFNVETNHLHFVGRVWQYVVTLLWNPPVTCGTLRMNRLSYHCFVDLTRRCCRAAAYHPPATVIFHLCLSIQTWDLWFLCKQNVPHDQQACTHVCKDVDLSSSSHNKLLAGVHLFFSSAPVCTALGGWNHKHWTDWNSTVERNCRDILNFGAKTYFCTKNPSRCDFLLFRLVGWLVYDLEPLFNMPVSTKK